MDAGISSEDRIGLRLDSRVGRPMGQAVYAADPAFTTLSTPTVGSFAWQRRQQQAARRRATEPSGLAIGLPRGSSSVRLESALAPASHGG